MKFKTTLFAIGAFLVFQTSSALAQNSKTINLDNNKNSFKIIEATVNKLTVENTISNLNYSTVETKQGLFTELNADQYAYSTEVGMPKVPIQKKLFQIPVNAEVKIVDISFTEKTINLNDLGISYKLKPLQNTVSKSEDANALPFEINKAIYNKNAYTANDIAFVEVLGIQRGTRIGRLNISPVSYNAHTNTLKVYTNIKVELAFVGGDISTTQRKSAQSINTTKLINASVYSKAASTQTGPVKFLIIADPEFKDSLQTFINWKTRKGFEVIEVYKGENGVGETSEEIKAHLKSIYESAAPENPAPLYALIVGDINQIPPFNGRKGDHVTDLHYFEYTDDYFPELFYGRFSANNFDELMPQINKTMEYEMYTMQNPSFLDEATLVGGVDASWGPAYANAHVNYGAEYYFNEAHGYNSNNYLQPNSGGYAEEIITTVNNGVGMLKYSGHCLPSGWLNPEFQISDVQNLTNEGMYPTVFGNCCESVRFENYSSFGEIWLRSKDKGAVGYIGASNLSYWVEDYYFDIGFGDNGSNPSYAGTNNAAMDLMFHENDEPIETWATTNGQIVQAGNLAVTGAGTDRVDYYWEVYHLMGDPSLMTYLTTPEAMTVVHPAEMPIGMNTLTIEAEQDAYVALSANNILFDAAFADANGKAILTLPLIETETTINVVATKQNKIPYTGTINGYKDTEPNVIYNAHINNDEQGNNNGMPEYGESISLDMEIINIGFSATENPVFKLSTSSNLVTISVDETTLETLDARTTLEINSAFTFIVNDDLTGQHTIPFSVKITDDAANEWNLNFESEIYGPEFMLEQISINDAQGGNHNINMDAGEIIELVYTLGNYGKTATPEMIGTLSCLNNDINILTNENVLNIIEADTSINSSFFLTINPDVEPGTIIDLQFNFEGYAQKYTITESYTISNLIEEFETNNFSLFNWDTTVHEVWSPFESSETESSYSGKRGLRSATIDHSDTSYIALSINALQADTISFYKKVSSQPGSSESTFKDYLEFMIDGESKGKWGGEIDWSYENFWVEAGEHTLTWRYAKSNFTSIGSDCAWIDLIQLPQDKMFTDNTIATFTSLPDTSIHAVQKYAYTIQTSDNEEDEIIISAVNLPEWLTLSASINGEATLSGTPDKTNTGSHLIMLSAFDGLASNYQVYTLTVKSPISIQQDATTKLIKVYPNPTQGIVNIQFIEEDKSIKTIQVYDALGKQVIEIVENNESEISINLSGFNQGIYFIKVQSANYTITEKVFVNSKN